MDTEQDNQPRYDYVIVGSGAGGGPLAGNLAKAGRKVLLLEAGSDCGDLYNYQVPAFHALASEDEHMRWDYFVRHYADDAQQQRDNKFVSECDGVLYPRSGALGGCTAHNAMITVYPHNSDWDHIAALTGDPSWRSEQMRKYFERLERCQYIKRPPVQCQPLLADLVRLFPFLNTFFGNTSRHGFDGWLSTNVADPSLVFPDGELLKVILSALEQALIEDLDRPLTTLESVNGFFDPNDWHAQSNGMQGLWFTPLATNAGQRNGTREYIRAVQEKFPDNLTVKTDALVTRVLFDDHNTAIGVEYLDGARLYRADARANEASDSASVVQVFVDREVILSAGTFNTPQLLKLSGIGPREELEQFGIQVRVELPGVGENLQDRYEVGVVTEMKANFPLLNDLTFSAPQEGQEPDPGFVAWQARKGLYTTNGVVLGMIKKSSKAQPRPDLYIFGLPTSFQGYFPGYSFEHSHNHFTWAILKAHTRNTAGRVKLRSNDPRDVPEINFHYFTEGNDAAQEDLESVADGVEFVRRMMKHAASVIEAEVLPGDKVSTRDEIKQFIKDNAWGHHASCTCKMGTADDAMAVVDSNFRVRGTRNLRIVDASVFPHIPGFFIVSAIYMISEKASDVILADT